MNIYLIFRGRFSETTIGQVAALHTIVPVNNKVDHSKHHLKQEQSPSVYEITTLVSTAAAVHGDVIQIQI